MKSDEKINRVLCWLIIRLVVFSTRMQQLMFFPVTGKVIGVLYDGTIIISHDNLFLISFFVRCIADVHEGVEKLLVYIKSVKGLGSIRDTVYDLLMNSRLFGAEVRIKSCLSHVCSH